MKATMMVERNLLMVDNNDFPFTQVNQCFIEVVELLLDNVRSFLQSFEILLNNDRLCET